MLDRSKLDPRLNLAEVERAITRISDLRVTVVGETIIDEYAYCDVVGKSGKEPVLVAEFSHQDVQAGGVLAIANHLADFCGQVHVVSALGEYERRESFVRSALCSEVTASFGTTPGGTTIVKRRYLDTYSRSKLLGVYRINEVQPYPIEGWHKSLRSAMETSDVVVVADYGHGLISHESASLIAEHAPYLCLNAQINATNFGYHVVSKYPQANFLCLHEGELRLNARNKEMPLEELLSQTSGEMSCDSILITLGRRGTLHYCRDRGISHCSALATDVVERVGAGDAVLALSSLASAARIEPYMINFLANLAGAKLVSTMGNGASLCRKDILESARVMLSSSRGRAPAMGRVV